MTERLLAFFPGGISPMEMLIVGVIALLLFGSRLPEVMRNLGKGITEFKRGMRGIEDDMESSSYRSSSVASQRPVPQEEREEVIAPKFEPPRFEPTAPAASSEEPKAV